MAIRLTIATYYNKEMINNAVSFLIEIVQKSGEIAAIVISKTNIAGKIINDISIKIVNTYNYG